MEQLRTNGFDPEFLNRVFSVVDGADDEILSLKGQHMQACKAPRARIKGMLKEAKDAGYNMQALRTSLAKHRGDRKIEQRLAELEADDLADYEEMQRALGAFGDTPLGEAALRRAKPRGEEVLDTLGDGPPPERADEEALEQVGRGS